MITLYQGKYRKIIKFCKIAKELRRGWEGRGLTFSFLIFLRGIFRFLISFIVRFILITPIIFKLHISIHKVIAINIEININVPFEYFLSKIMLVGTFASNNGFKIGTQFYDLTRLGLQCQTPALSKV